MKDETAERVADALERIAQRLDEVVGLPSSSTMFSDAIRVTFLKNEAD
jgi:hypothetical protein